MNQSRELERALGLMTGRLRHTAEKIGDGFPHYANQANGQWVTSPTGDWTGGFGVGQLWLAYANTKDDALGSHARTMSHRLLPRANSDTVFRGFLFYYGAALGAILCNDKEAADVALSGAKGFASAYNDSAGMIPLGTTAEEASDVGNDEANIDGLPGGVLLVWAAERSNDHNMRQIAAAHAKRHIDLCVRSDGSVVQSVTFNPESGTVTRRYTHKGFSNTSTWARAQAWAMLGFALNAQWLNDKDLLLHTGRRVADWWIDHIPTDKVAYWDFDAPVEDEPPRDTSATAIAAAALLKLSELSDNSTETEKYRRFAEDTTEILCREYLTTGEDNRPPGILTAGCYNYPLGLATANELVWGDYYLYETLHVLTGRLDPLQI